MGAELKHLAFDQITNDFMTPEAQDLVNKAKALTPVLAELARKTEQDGEISAEIVKRISDEGLFRILQPKRWGGSALDPRVFYRCQMAIAEGCMSTAWMYGVVGVHFWQLGLFSEKAQEEVWGDDPSTLIASTYMPVGKAEAVEGGYRFSGHWRFSTGVKHCKWIFLGGLVPDEETGMKHVTFLLPRSDFKIVENWDVLGLRGTGTHDIIVDDVFVPDYRTNETNNNTDEACPGRVKNTDSLYRIPFAQVFQRAVSTACIGALDGAIAAFRKRSAEHVGAHGSATANDVSAQMAVTEAMMLTDQLKLVLSRNYQEVSDYAARGEQMPVEARLFHRAQSAYVAKSCAEKVNELMRVCAASGTFKDNPVERFFRDLNQARGHIANNADAYIRAHGAVMLGLPNQDPFV